MDYSVKSGSGPKNFLSSFQFTTTLLLSVIIFALFNFNFDVFKAGAETRQILGEGQPGFIPKWITPTVFPPDDPSNVTVTQPNYCVSGPAATVGWNYSDPSGSPQSAYQVQIDDQGSFNSPEWDSGKVFCSGCRSNSTTQGILQFNITYRARVRAWNQFDAVSDWTVSDTWKTPPFAYPQVDFTFSPSSPIPNSPVQFTDQTAFYDSNPNGRRWSWLFGDGGSSTQQNPQHSYNQANNYNATLTATDNANQSCSVTEPVNVQVPNPIWKEVNPGD